MGILIVYDVTDERSFSSGYLEARLRRRTAPNLAIPHNSRHPNMVFQRRDTRFGKREQDSRWKQVRLGR